MKRPVLFGRFGELDVLEFVVQSDADAEATLISYGAAIRDLKVPTQNGLRRVVLGFNTLGDYVDHSRWHLGAVPGRVANRIGGGRFSLDGRVYALPRNQDGRHTLHSGPAGFGARVWSLLDYDQRSVTLALISDDGDQGFPGRLTTTVCYRFLEPATLQISYSATTSRSTPVNLTNHAYFNLDGTGNILSHRLVLEADYFTPTDKDLIPTGEILGVGGTPWDFRKERPILLETYDGPFHYDGNVVLRSSGELAKAARVVSSNRDIAMEVWTTMPGLQFFDAATLKVSATGLDGRVLQPRDGFCLEPQFFPDSINKAHFPNCVLTPDSVYKQQTEYRFDSA